MNLLARSREGFSRLVSRRFGVLAQVLFGTGLALLAIFGNEGLETFTERNLLFLSIGVIAVAGCLGGAVAGGTSTFLTGTALSWIVVRENGEIDRELVVRITTFWMTGAIVAFVSAALKRVMLEAQRSRQIAEDAVRARNEFIAMASHELRTPITALHLNAQMRRRAFATRPESCTPEEFTRFVEMTMNTTGRLGVLIEDMVEFSRMGKHRISIRKEKVSLGKIVDQVLTQLSVRGRERIQNAVVDATGWWDPVRIAQVITNLVSNAIQYGEGKPITLKSEIRKDQVLFSVSDEGPGIAPENLEKVFRKFERLTEIRAAKGMGLGLYISRAIVEAHRGQITVESEPGHGTTFKVVLPLGNEAPAN